MAEIKKIKPSLPKGTRDFLPAEVAKRNYIFDTIKSVFRKYGFQQIDTPAFERLETLTGKYGEEGDRLLFKILNSGDPFKDLTKEDAPVLSSLSDKLMEKVAAQYLVEISKEPTQRFLNENGDLDTSLRDKFINEKAKLFDEEIQKGSKRIAQKLTEKGLRYDLTVPLARYVVQHNGELVFPFKRFHIGPVWRADRPQKGRYQEFYQCDADVIGSTSLLNEVELTQIYVEVFKKLNIPVSIEVSSRKFLYGFAKLCGAEGTFTEFTTIIDKQDKIGDDKVTEELNLLKEGVGDRYTELMSQINKDSEKNLNEVLNDLLLQFEKANCQEGVDGLKEIKVVLEMTLGFGSIDDKVRFSPTLARGLGYYSGIIWEVKPIGVQMGSIGGGGRYDNLTEMFGGRDMSGVGISFGIERIYDVMEELNLFPAELGESTKVLFVHFDEASEAYGFEQLQKVRAADIASEIYPGKKKLDKQMNYANDKKIPFVIVIGGDEMASGKLTLKNMKSGEQQKLSIDEIIEILK